LLRFVHSLPLLSSIRHLFSSSLPDSNHGTDLRWAGPGRENAIELSSKTVIPGLQASEFRSSSLPWHWSFCAVAPFRSDLQRKLCTGNQSAYGPCRARRKPAIEKPRRVQD
jgi:hypothetical protein